MKQVAKKSEKLWEYFKPIWIQSIRWLGDSDREKIFEIPVTCIYIRLWKTPVLVKNRSFTGSVLDLENFREVATNNTQINNQSTKKQLLEK